MKIKSTIQPVLYFLILFISLQSVGHAQQSSTPVGTKPGAVLMIGDHSGLDKVDVESASQLIISEFRKLGIIVSAPVYETGPSGQLYRITFRRLGEKILVNLSQESPLNTIVIEKQLWLANIEEMIQAAPRLVDALVHNKPITSSVDIETVTQQEAREFRKIVGESLWNIGIFGSFIPGTDVVAEPGWEFGWSYETPKYGIGTEFRYSGNHDYDGKEDFSFTSLSIGGRYFLNSRNISPYIGGGFSIFSGSYDEGYYYDDDDYDYGYDYDSHNDSGLGAYFVGGISMLRLTKSRLKLELRVDRPFFSLPNRDMMPITFGIFFSQNYVPGQSCFSLF